MEEMPKIGFGLWKIEADKCAGIVMEAARAGYRHFDSASDYGNEAAMGEGLKASLADGICGREDLWITSKLWNTNHAPEHVRPACLRSMNDLGVDYLDLYMIHFPISLSFVPEDVRYPPEWFFDPEADSPAMRPAPVPLHETWGAMEELVREGLVRHIGVCNYNSALIHDLAAYAGLKPAMLQIESHPYLTQEKLIQTASGYGIPVTAFSPLGALSYVSIDMATPEESVLAEPVVKDAAEDHGKTPAQIVLRWGVQRGTAVIPKSVSPLRMRENLDIFDFALTAEEMTAISGLNRNRRFNDPGVFCAEAFNTAYSIYD